MPYFTVRGPMAIPAGGGDSAAFTNFFARTSGLDATHIAAYKALLNGLTTDGFFNSSGTTLKLDGLYVITDTEANFVLNLCQNAFNLSKTGAVTYVANVSVKSDGATGFYNTGFNPNTAGGLMSLNSACLGAYEVGISIPAGTECLIGCFDGSVFSVLISPASEDKRTFLNDATTLNSITGLTAGMWAGNRSASNARQLYKPDGSADVSDAIASVSLANQDLYILARNQSGTADQFAGTNGYSGFFFGGSLSGTDISNLKSRLDTFMATV